MSIPIDEMLSDLRAALEDFQAAPSDETLDAVWRETKRIGRTCENELPDTDN